MDRCLGSMGSEGSRHSPDTAGRGAGGADGGGCVFVAGFSSCSESSGGAGSGSQCSSFGRRQSLGDCGSPALHPSDGRDDSDGRQMRPPGRTAAGQPTARRSPLTPPIAEECDPDAWAGRELTERDMIRLQIAAAARAWPSPQRPRGAGGWADGGPRGGLTLL